MEAERFITDWTFGTKVGKVDKEKGIIHDVAIVTAGEAKGHGVQLDSEFVATVIEQGNALKGGATMRFGHPTMSGNALGTFMGKAKNFYVDTNGIGRAKDVFLSNAAKEAPSGNLHKYILELADEHPDAFGTSIVFKPGRKYSRDEAGDKDYENLSADELPFIECDVFSKVDFVDDPAANPEGLFATAFNSETIAGQVSEFLDTHPQVWEVLHKKPEIIEGFMAKYSEFKARLTTQPFNEGDSVEAANELASVDAKPTEEKQMEKEVIQKINDEFGAEVLAATMLSDGDYESAKALYASNEALEQAEQLSVALDNIVALEAQVVELSDKLEALSQGEEAVVSEDAPVVTEDKPVDVMAEIKSRTDEGMSAKEAQDAVAKEHPEAFKAFNGER